MGYELHLERDPPITLNEWKAAVSKAAHVRLNSGGTHIINPKTHETISIPGIDGDAEIDTGNGWRVHFRWSDTGSIAFPYSDEFNHPDSLIRQTVKSLASALDAQVIGDEGEAYDFDI